MAKLSMWFSLLGAFQCHPRVYAVKHQLLEDLLPKKKKNLEVGSIIVT